MQNSSMRLESFKYRLIKPSSLTITIQLGPSGREHNLHQSATPAPVQALLAVSCVTYSCRSTFWRM